MKMDYGNNNQIITTSFDWESIFESDQYKPFKVAPYKIRKIEKFAARKHITLKRYPKNEKNEYPFVFVNGKAHIISTVPISFSSWNQLKADLAYLLKQNKLPVDLFDI